MGMLELAKRKLAEATQGVADIGRTAGQELGFVQRPQREVLQTSIPPDINATAQPAVAIPGPDQIARVPLMQRVHDAANASAAGIDEHIRKLKGLK